MERIKIIRACTASYSVDFFREVMKLMRDRGFEMIAVASPGECLERLHEEDGFKVIGVEIERHISLWKDFRALCRLVKIFIKEKPLIVHSITPKAGLLCMISARIARVPVRIHTFTGLIWPTSTGFKRKVLIATDKITCACATHIIPEGEGVKKDLHEQITNKPMRILGYGNVMGVDMETWNPLRFTDIKKNPDVFTFLFTGRIVGDKGINELVWAFSELRKEYPKVKLMLVGAYESLLDPLLPETDSEIESNSSIEVSGPFFGDDLVKVYAQADCMITPSYREGFPNSVLEAGAMGLPQIVTDVNGSREIICDGENGLIVPPKDKVALLNAMRRLYQDKDLCDSISSKARVMIASRFERSFVLQCQIDFYDDILNSYV